MRISLCVSRTHGFGSQACRITQSAHSRSKMISILSDAVPRTVSLPTPTRLGVWPSSWTPGFFMRPNVQPTAQAPRLCSQCTTGGTGVSPVYSTIFLLPRACEGGVCAADGGGLPPSLILMGEGRGEGSPLSLSSLLSHPLLLPTQQKNTPSTACCYRKDVLPMESFFVSSPVANGQWPVPSSPLTAPPLHSKNQSPSQHPASRSL